MSVLSRRIMRPQPGIELGALQESLGFFVLRASRKLSHDWTSHWHEKQHRPLFYCAFALIGANPGISPANLARFLVLDKSRASDLIDTLESENSIIRQKNSTDHRRLGIYLTTAGMTRLADLVVEMKHEDERLHRLFNEAERQQFISFLSRIADAEAKVAEPVWPRG
jgi:DNA-binding MarR family transcriptional regulator